MTVPLLLAGGGLVGGGGVFAGAAVAAERQPAPGAERADVWLARESFVMGTLLRLEVAAPTRAAAAEASEHALAAVHRLDGLLSTWDGSAEMARLNAASAGSSAAVSAALLALLLEAEVWSKRTGRAFEPAVGPLIDAWELRGEGRVPDGAALRAALRAVRAGVTLDAAAGTLTRNDPAGWIDTGAFGKGAALAAAADALRTAGVADAVLDFGGQIMALGRPADGGGWRVPVAHPRHRHQAVGELLLRDVSAATSGASERFIEVDGQRYGHLLDPRTGQPVPAWGSVTVVAADPLAADALSTALFVLGPRAGMAWARDREDVAVLFLEDTPRGLVPHWNPAMERWLTRTIQTERTLR
ncbi:MAG: FAD:protein FMN transferase [Gemmatimonadota bacterium]